MQHCNLVWREKYWDRNSRPLPNKYFAQQIMPLLAKSPFLSFVTFTCFPVLVVISNSSPLFTTKLHDLRQNKSGALRDWALEMGLGLRGSQRPSRFGAKPKIWRLPSSTYTLFVSLSTATLVRHLILGRAGSSSSSLPPLVLHYCMYSIELYSGGDTFFNPWNLCIILMFSWGGTLIC